MVLSKRLQACADMVRPMGRVCDVGTDHGKLACYLVEQGIVTGAIATDLNAQPLKRAGERIAARGLQEQIQLMQTDGLQGVPQMAVDDIVIAGMGGELIGNILANRPWREDASKRYLLQPMTQHAWLRRWLSEAGFLLEREVAVWERGHWYPVMMASDTGERRRLQEWESVVGVLPQNFEDETMARAQQEETAAYLWHQAKRLLRVAEEKERAKQHRLDTTQERALAAEIVNLIPIAMRQALEACPQTNTNCVSFTNGG